MEPYVTCLCVFLLGGDFQNKVKKIRNPVDRPDEFNGPQDVLLGKKNDQEWKIHFLKSLLNLL